MPNIFSGAPVLIDDYQPVGETFIGDITGINLNSWMERITEDIREYVIPVPLWL